MQIRVMPGSGMPPTVREEIEGLCARAYGTDLRALLATFVDPVHVVAMVDGAIVSHALWVTRWIQADDGPLLRTAYVEAVATEPAHRGRGHASAVMQTLVREVRHFDLSALCASDEARSLYLRLGWEEWQGPLFIRHANERIGTPDEKVMIYRLPDSPALDLGASLSAEWREGELW